MVTEPKIESRLDKPYASIRIHVSMSELGSGIIPQLHDEVMSWLKQQGSSANGAPFLKYNVINMADQMELEMGWPTEEILKGSERITTGTLPAGDYAFVVYTGDYSGLMDANRVLIEWGRDNHHQWDGDTSPAGDTFIARYETYITDPGDEPNPAKWITEVAIKVK